MFTVAPVLAVNVTPLLYRRSLLDDLGMSLCVDKAANWGNETPLTVAVQLSFPLPLIEQGRGVH